MPMLQRTSVPMLAYCKKGRTGYEVSSSMPMASLEATAARTAPPVVSTALTAPSMPIEVELEAMLAALRQCKRRDAVDAVSESRGRSHSTSTKRRRCFEHDPTLLPLFSSAESITVMSPVIESGGRAAKRRRS